MSSRIAELFARKRDVLSLYIMAGYPALDDTVRLCEAAQRAGADLLEIGIPFSDPVADGPTIQRCSEAALKNGMTMELLFRQIGSLRRAVTIPVVLMGYINPVLQFGMERFCEEAERCGIDGAILPDLPPEEYERSYRELFERAGLAHVMLITSRTAPERIRHIDALARGFLYLVSSEATTGGELKVDAGIGAYFERIAGMSLRNPLVVGFGISNAASFKSACRHAHGAIVASAFLRQLEERGAADQTVTDFVKSIRGEAV